MSTKHYDAAYAGIVSDLNTVATECSEHKDRLGTTLLVAVHAIAKRDERIEALERRLAALEGDAK